MGTETRGQLVTQLDVREHLAEVPEFSDKRHGGKCVSVTEDNLRPNGPRAVHTRGKIAPRFHS